MLIATGPHKQATRPTVADPLASIAPRRAFPGIDRHRAVDGHVIELQNCHSPEPSEIFSPRTLLKTPGRPW